MTTLEPAVFDRHTFATMLFLILLFEQVIVQYFFTKREDLTFPWLVQLILPLMNWCLFLAMLALDLFYLRSTVKKFCRCDCLSCLHWSEYATLFFFLAPLRRALLYAYDPRYAGKDALFFDCWCGVVMLASAVGYTYARTRTHLSPTVGLFLMIYIDYFSIGVENLSQFALAVHDGRSHSSNPYEPPGILAKFFFVGLIYGVPSVLVWQYRATIFGFMTRRLERAQRKHDGAYIAAMLDHEACTVVVGVCACLGGVVGVRAWWLLEGYSRAPRD